MQRGAGPSSHYQTGAVEASSLYWVQVVGSNLTAGWLAQLASTLPGKPLSHLVAANVWKRDFIPAHEPVERWVDVPEDPGLGVDIDGETIEAFRRTHAPGRTRRISTVSYLNGRLWSFAAGQQRQETFCFDHLEGLTHGVRLDIHEDDHTQEFSELYARCLEAS
jgi:hypothetical protein